MLFPHLLYILYQIFRKAQIFVGFFWDNKKTRKPVRLSCCVASAVLDSDNVSAVWIISWEIRLWRHSHLVDAFSKELGAHYVLCLQSTIFCFKLSAFSIFSVKSPWLKSRDSDSPSGFSSLATRLYLPFYLLSCFICPMHCLPAVSYSDSLSVSLLWQSYCGAGFLSGLSPRLPRFPEVPLLRYLVISVSGVLVYMWPVLPVAGFIVISEESAWRFICYREPNNPYSFLL